MASAEQLLNEAQFAFQSITAGDSSENRRNAARAKSLCKKIFRKYPGTSEAVVAHGIMMRLGEETTIPRVHESHKVDSPVTVTEISTMEVPNAGHQPEMHGHAERYTETVPLDWGGLMSVILGTSRTVLGVIIFAGLILFGTIGPFLFLPLIAVAFLSSPLRATMKPAQRRQMNAFVKQANAWIAERRNAGRGLF